MADIENTDTGTDTGNIKEEEPQDRGYMEVEAEAELDDDELSDQKMQRAADAHKNEDQAREDFLKKHRDPDEQSNAELKEVADAHEAASKEKNPALLDKFLEKENEKRKESLRQFSDEDNATDLNMGKNKKDWTQTVQSQDKDKGLER